MKQSAFSHPLMKNYKLKVYNSIILECCNDFQGWKILINFHDVMNTQSVASIQGPRMEWTKEGGEEEEEQE